MQKRKSENKKQASKKRSLSFRKQRSRLDSYSRFESIKGKLLNETQAIKVKHRSKFDPTTEQGKHAENMGGVVVRSTGRAMAGWMAGL